MRKAQIIALLLSLAVALPAVADKHSAKNAQTDEKDSEAQEGNIGDDAGLITDEFSYTYLFDQSYGIIGGFGKSSPRHLMHLEGFTFLYDRLGVAMLIGYSKDHHFNTEKYKLSADTVSLSAKARYYLPLLPFSVNASCGYVFWDGNITPTNSQAYDYKSSETYLGISLSAYYFWKTGIYVESVIYGRSFSTPIGLKTDAKSEHADFIEEEIGKSQAYGIFGGGLLNIAVGYML